MRTSEEEGRVCLFHRISFFIRVGTDAGIMIQYHVYEIPHTSCWTRQERVGRTVKGGSAVIPAGQSGRLDRDVVPIVDDCYELSALSTVCQEIFTR